MEMHESETAKRPFLTYAQTAELLGVKQGTLYAWVSRRVIPFVRLSPRVVRFRRVDLDTWLAERQVEVPKLKDPAPAGLEPSRDGSR